MCWHHGEPETAGRHNGVVDLCEKSVHAANCQEQRHPWALPPSSNVVRGQWAPPRTEGTGSCKGQGTVARGQYTPPASDSNPLRHHANPPFPLFPRRLLLGSFHTSPPPHEWGSNDCSRPALGVLPKEGFQPLLQLPETAEAEGLCRGGGAVQRRRGCAEAKGLCRGTAQRVVGAM